MANTSKDVVFLRVGYKMSVNDVLKECTCMDVREMVQ